MRSAVRDIIEGALETVVATQRSEWVGDWPSQAILVAAFINATSHCQEAIKGGASALKDLMSKYQEFNAELAEVIEECGDTSSQEVLSSLVIHDMYTRDTIGCLITDQVVSEKDYAWRSRPKSYMVEQDVVVEMLLIKEKYFYEYLGDCVHQVWTRSFEKSMYTFFTAFSLKNFPLIKAHSSSGKHVLVQEVSRILAQNLIVRPVTPMTTPTRLTTVINYPT